jgi:PhnB protein
VSLLLYVSDCDAVFQQSVAAGAKVLRPLTDQFYGDRSGTVADPFGHEWTIATHQEDLSDEEMNQRAAAAFAQMS